MKIRSLAVLPALALGCLALTGCDSKVGAAAVVGGTKITESQLQGYLTPSAKPITATDSTGAVTSSTPARTFVLGMLLQNEIYPKLLAAGGASVTDAKLQAAKVAILQGHTEQELTQLITQSGLKANFEPVYLRNYELSSLIQTELTTAQQKQNALNGIKKYQVHVSPRYGSWDASSSSLVDLGKKQLPSMLAFDGTLPGDVTTPPAQ